MAISAFSLPSGAKILTFLWALSQSASAVPQPYILDTSFSGSTFFNGWDFFTDSDPTHGFVTYVGQSAAQSAGLIFQAPRAPAYMGVDSKTTLSTSGSGRQSVRITTQKTWTHGLFIGDIAHMPDSTCGVWPAFWMFGPNWPSSGEVDIIEGVSRATENKMSLHSGPNCVMTAGTQSGTTGDMQCDGTQNGNSGCSVDSNTASSYGTGFNNIGGGVYATEWTSDYIQTWFFPRGSIPTDIMSGMPMPSEWGTPQSSFNGGSNCNIDTHFMNQSLVFDTTFCGDWAGNVWSSDSVCSGLASTCVDYVAGNPSAFANTYWKVNSVKVYQLRYAPPPPPTFTTSTTRSSTSSSTTKSLTTSSSSSRVTTSSSSTKSTSTTKPPSSTSKQITSSPSKSPTSTSKPSATPTAPAWTSLGCYSDNISGRALPNGKTVVGGSNAMAVEACQSACKASGYVIAGLEYGRECWCGNAFANGGAYVGKDGANGCTMACKGSAKEWCGGSNLLSAWRWG